MQLLQNYSYVFGFLVIGAGFVVVNTILPQLISPRSKGSLRQEPYESGEVPIGSAWIQFDIQYYLFALIFIAFDVEVAFLFPVLVAYKSMPGFAIFWEMTLFMSVLSLAILYAWKKGLFQWK